MSSSAAASLRDLFTSLRTTLALDASLPTQHIDLSCDDIKLLEPEAELSARCKELADEWARLDETFLWKERKRKVKPTYVFGSKYLTIPGGLDILNLSDSQIDTLRHNDIPETQRREYLQGLFDIFRRMPLAAEIESRCQSADLELMRLRVANDPNPFSETYRKLFVPEINYLPSETESFQPMRHSVSVMTSIDILSHRHTILLDTIIVMPKYSFLFVSYFRMPFDHRM